MIKPSRVVLLANYSGHYIEGKLMWRIEEVRRQQSEREIFVVDL